MVKAIYRVKIPDPEKEGEYKIFEFKSPKEVCEKLKIPEPTLYAIIKGRIKYKHKCIEHIKNIIIEKEVIKPEKKYKKEIREPDVFIKELIEELEK